VRYRREYHYHLVPHVASFVCDLASIVVDFDLGTLIIRKPGKYRLCENISFRPNFPLDMTDDDFETLFDADLDKYSPNAYGLGFFAAIAIESHHVEIDLNGYALEQSPEHALM
jgi:hypothetical protein